MDFGDVIFSTVRMTRMTELLFYGGLLLTGLSLAGAILAAIVLRFHRRRLLAALDEEYGKRDN